MRKIVLFLLSLSLLFLFTSCASEFEKAVDDKEVELIRSLYNKAEEDNDYDLLEEYDDILCNELQELYDHLKDYEVSEDDLNNVSSDEEALELVAGEWKPICSYPHGTFQIIGDISTQIGDKCMEVDDMLISKVNYIMGCINESDEDYEQATTCFYYVIKEDCMFEEATEKRINCLEKYAEELKSQAVSSIDAEYFDDALNSLSDIQRLIDDNDVDTSKLEDIYKDTANKYIDGYIDYKIKNFNPNDYKEDSDSEEDDDDNDNETYSLQDEINDELSVLNVENFEDKVSTTLKTNGDKYIQKAKEFFKKGDVEAAIGNVDAALMFLPNDSDYKKQKAEYVKYRPFKLYDEDSFFQIDDYYDDISIYKEEVANDNKKYKNVIAIHSYNTDECSVTYNLAGNYDTVSGVQFLGENSKDKNDWCVTSFFKAYGDGKLIYTSKTMDTGVLPEIISFNVSGIQKLEIVFCSELYPENVGNTVWRGTSLYVSNFVAKKNIPK